MYCWYGTSKSGIVCTISFERPEAMFTLYRIGFCSVAKVAPAKCEQELMFCCCAEIVPKRSQCEQKPYPLCNLQRSLLIWKENLPKRGSVAISAPIKVFRLDSDRLKNLSDTERSTFNSGAEQYCSGAETASKPAFLVWTEALSGTLSATLRFTIRYSVNIAWSVPLNVYSPSAIIGLSLLNRILMARFLKQSFAQTCLKETDNGKLQQFNYSRSLITNGGTVERGKIHSKVCTISFERPEASPWTCTVPVQLSAFHYLTAS